MKVMLVVNSAASSVNARTRVVIRKALSADHDVTLAETSRRGHATRLAQGAAADGYDAVVVLGGDGTLNEAANGLAGTSTALGVLPGGSTNVYARTIGMTNDPVEATEQLLDAIARGSRRRIGLGSANGRYFLFHVGIGFDAAVVEQVERRGGLKRYVGHPLFMYSGFAAWFKHYDRKRVRFTVSFGDEQAAVGGWFAICLKRSPYTYLGNVPLDIAPEATFDRGLSMLTFKLMSFPAMMAVIFSALRTGRFVRRTSKVDFRTDLEELVVTGDGPFPYQVDGDFLGEIDRLELRHEPECLDLILP